MINTNYSQSFCSFKCNPSDLNDIDVKVISYIKTMPDVALSMYMNDLLFTNDWDGFLIQIIQPDNNQKLKMSDRGLIEVLKIIIEKLPHCTWLLRFVDVNQEARVEIGKEFAEKSPELFFINIDDFGIDEAGFIEICRKITVNIPTIIMKELLGFNIRNEKNLLEVLWLAAEKRPDMVMKSIYKMKIQDQAEKNNVILQCVTQIPSVALNSKKISAWIDLHQVLVFQNPVLKKMVQDSKVGPSPQMGKIFRLFKDMANPSTSHIELAARCLWLSYFDYKNVQQNDPDYKEKLKLYNELTNSQSLIKLDNLNKCGVTALALQYAVFGHEKGNQICLEENDYRKEKLDEVWGIIKKNEDGFDEFSLSPFFSYFFYCGGIDHCFVIIQYRDAQNQVKYKLLQSWVGKHSLNDYMEKRPRDLNSDEFALFAEGLNHVLFNEHHTEQKEIFFKNYFMKQAKCSYFSQKSVIDIEWNCSNGRTVTKNLREFEQVKRYLEEKSVL